MTLINLEFIVQKTPKGVAIFLPTTQRRLDGQGMALLLTPRKFLPHAEPLLENSVHRYSTDPYGVIRHTTKWAENKRVHEITDFYKRLNRDNWIIFRPKNSEAITEWDLQDASLHGQLILGPESLQYWASRALFGAEFNDTFPKTVSTPLICAIM